MFKKNNNRCPLTGEIVSYLYGEIEGAAEEAFEAHLAECIACTDEFAAVAEARYSVFEWKKEAFDALPTPAVVIPYGEYSPAAAGWAETIRAWAASLSVPVAAAAALAVCVGAAAIWLGYVSDTEQQLAANVTAPTATERPDVAVTVPLIQTDETDANQAAPPLRPSVASASQRKQSVKRLPAQRPPASFTIAPGLSTEARNAPALTQSPENGDNSPRLADLFDEVGG